MPNEEKEQTQKEIDMQAIDEICKQLSNYMLHFVTNLKFDDNGKMYADPELQEYIKNAREKLKKRTELFANKKLLKIAMDEKLKESEEFAIACAKIIETIRKQDQASGKTSNYIEDIIEPAENYLFARDRINNRIFNRPIPADGSPTIVDEKGETNSGVNSILYFNVDSAAEETDMNERNITLSEFDKQILNAVISLMRAGNKIITPQSIYQVLSHNCNAKVLTDNWKTKIDKSMTKLNSIQITANFNNALSFYPNLKEFDISTQTRLLQFEKIIVKHRNGYTGIAYKMLSEPVLYTIAEIKNQIGTISLKGLTNQKTVKSVDVSILYNWLLVRIDGMKHEKNPLSKTIKLESMYSCLNKKTPKEQRTTRENAELLLIQFKADKLIKDFNFISEKNKITKLNISV